MKRNKLEKSLKESGWWFLRHGHQFQDTLKLMRFIAVSSAQNQPDSGDFRIALRRYRDIF